MYWTLELASYLSDAPWPATKDELIDYSMGFPFYQGLNPLLNGKSNKGHLVSGIVES